LILATNNRPRITEDSEAVWRRLRFVPFNYVVPESKRDPALLLKLRDEYPGILGFLVRGFQQWQASGLSDSPAVTLATKKFRGEANSFEAFLTQRCILDGAAMCLTAHLREAYERWCIGCRRMPEPLRIAAETLRRKGCTSRKHNGNWHWSGITLLDGTA
jgi:putative DNA primase/helicase